MKRRISETNENEKVNENRKREGIQTEGDTTERWREDNIYEDVVNGW